MIVHTSYAHIVFNKYAFAAVDHVRFSLFYSRLSLFILSSPHPSIMERFHHFRSTDTFVLIAMCFAIFTDTFLYGMVCLLLRTLGIILTQQIIPILPYLLIQKSGVFQEDGMLPPLRNGSCSTDWTHSPTMDLDSFGLLWRCSGRWCS